MNDLNSVCVTGRAVSDVKLYEYEDKVKYSFVVAVNYYSMKKKEQFTDFLPVGVWRSKPTNAEVSRVKKGDKILVSGRVSLRKYEKNGQNQLMMELAADYVNIVQPIKKSDDLNELLSIIQSNESLLTDISKLVREPLKETLMAS